MWCANNAAAGIINLAVIAVLRFGLVRRVFQATGNGRVAVAKRALQQHCVGPPAEAEGDRFQHAGALEAVGFVQAERGRVVAVDVADHLAVAGGGAGLDQGRQQLSADA